MSKLCVVVVTNTQRRIWGTGENVSGVMADTTSVSAADAKVLYDNARKELVAALAKKRVVDKSLVSQGHKLSLAFHGHIILVSIRHISKASSMHLRDPIWPTLRTPAAISFMVSSRTSRTLVQPRKSTRLQTPTDCSPTAARPISG